MSEPLDVWIGYDPAEAVASRVLAHSILRRATIPVRVHHLSRALVAGVYTRPRGPLESTEFSFTRFLVPYLSGYAGHALFLDCDMLCLADLAELLARADADPGRTVYVCQHDYTPRHAMKFANNVQTKYPRKNWTSLMLFDNARCRRLTPAYVNATEGLDLHRFWWTPDRDIGALPLEWNYLVDEPGQSPALPKIVHFTNGGPWFPDYAHVEHADRWRAEHAAMLGAAKAG